jgi:glycosyltransferase involved in cell wall biosynthesis
MNQRRLHVAFDNSLAGRNETGTGVYASQLIRALAAHREIDLTVFSGWGSGSRGGKVLRKFRALARFAWSHAYFPFSLRWGKFDVLHAPAFIFPIGCPCSAVVTIHDLSFLTHPHHFDRGWRTYVTSLMPSVLRAANGIICISQSTRRDLLRFYDVPETKVHVIYNGLDHSQFHGGAKLDQDWANSVGIRKPYVLHVGVFSERKNIPALLRAVAKLRDEGRFRGYQLVLAGKGAPGVVGARSIEETIRDFRLQDLVLKVGHVPNEKIAGLYAGAIVLTMPSLYEGFGLPVLEAMATGTPVVASDTSSLPEVAGDAALLVPPEDESALAEAIHRLLSDDALRAGLRLKGFEQVKKFSWERTAEQTVQIYRTVAGS